MKETAVEFTKEEIKLLADGLHPGYIRDGLDCETVIVTLARRVQLSGWLPYPDNTPEDKENYYVTIINPKYPEYKRVCEACFYKEWILLVEPDEPWEIIAYRKKFEPYKEGVT